jgi:hypothetical protein
VGLGRKYHMRSGTMVFGRDPDQGVSGVDDEVRNHYSNSVGMLIRMLRSGYFGKKAYRVLPPLDVIRGWKVIR